jgi:hypothetical protein
MNADTGSIALPAQLPLPKEMVNTALKWSLCIPFQETPHDSTRM